MNAPQFSRNLAPEISCMFVTVYLVCPSIINDRWRNFGVSLRLLSGMAEGGFSLRIPPMDDSGGATCDLCWGHS